MSISDLYGDAYSMHGFSKGGNDVLTGGDDISALNSLYGDAYQMFDSSIGGNDTLISGTGTDNMWGDAQSKTGGVTTGADTFVFKPGSRNDVINDFETAKDRIDVSAYGFTGIGALIFTDLGSDTLINFGGVNNVTLTGIADPSLLTASMFIFA